MLFDGSQGGRLLPQLRDRLGNRALDRIDMAVSFVMKSGLARIVGRMEDALDRGAHVRILTTDYLAITDPDALTQLADRAPDPDRQLEVRLFSGGSIAFHPKAHIFWSSAGETAAGYAGSSNLSDNRPHDCRTSTDRESAERIAASKIATGRHGLVGTRARGHGI